MTVFRKAPFPLFAFSAEAPGKSPRDDDKRGSFNAIHKSKREEGAGEGKGKRERRGAH